MRLLTLWICLVGIGISAIHGQDQSSLNLLFVGDIMGHGPQIKSAYVPENNAYDYTPCFKYVAPIIEKADLAIGNLEVTLPGKAPYKGYPMFRSPDALAAALRGAGFDMLVTSNNHSNDGGLLGINHTIDVLKSWGFYQTGTFKNQNERDYFYPMIAYKNGFRIAFLNYTYDTNGLPTPSPAVVNLIDEDQIEEDLEMAKKLKPDAIIVVMHWGLEYQLNESTEQRKLADNMLKWGADMIIGAHPHVVQPIKTQAVIMPDSTVKEGLVVYSMGNFISNQQKVNTDGGIMFEVTLHKKGTGKATIGKHHYIPVWRYLDKDNSLSKYGTYYVMPISAAEKDSTNVLKMSSANRAKMKNYGDRTRKHLNKYGAKERDLTLKDIGVEQPKAKPTSTSYVLPEPVSYEAVTVSEYVPFGTEELDQDVLGFAANNEDPKKKKTKTNTTIPGRKQQTKVNVKPVRTTDSPWTNLVGSSDTIKPLVPGRKTKTTPPGLRKVEPSTSFAPTQENKETTEKPKPEMVEKPKPNTTYPKPPTSFEFTEPVQENDDLAMPEPIFEKPNIQPTKPKEKVASATKTRAENTEDYSKNITPTTTPQSYVNVRKKYYRIQF